MNRREFLKGASAAAVATALPVAAVLPSVEAAALGPAITATEIDARMSALAAEYRRQFIEGFERYRRIYMLDDEA